jgi:hypothetical protein
VLLVVEPPRRGHDVLHRVEAVVHVVQHLDPQLVLRPLVRIWV